MLDSFSWTASSLPLWVSLSLIFLYLAAIVGLAESLNRQHEKNSELTRKIVHIGSGNVILLAWWLEIPAAAIVSAAAIAGSIAIASYFTPILPGINSVGRQSWGTFFYAVSVGMSVACFWQIQQPEYAAIGILIMAWGDGMAALVGQHWGRHPYQVFGMNKTWEGSLTMGGVSFLVSCCILSAIQGSNWQTWAVSLAVAVAATGLESFSQWGIDNLLVPLGSAALAFLLNRAI